MTARIANPAGATAIGVRSLIGVMLIRLMLRNRCRAPLMICPSRRFARRRRCGGVDGLERGVEISDDLDDDPVLSSQRGRQRAHCGDEGGDVGALALKDLDDLAG